MCDFNDVKFYQSKLIRKTKQFYGLLFGQVKQYNYRIPCRGNEF